MALAFTNGSTSESVNAGSAAVLDNLPDAPFSWLAWIYADSTGNWRNIWQKNVPSGAYLLFYTGSPYTRLWWDVRGASNNSYCQTSAGTLATNTWQCFFGTFDTGDSQHCRLYKGSLTSALVECGYQTTANNFAGGANDAAADLEFGAGTAGAAYGHRAAFFQLFNRKLTLAEAISLQFRPRNVSGCVAFFDFGYNGTGTQPDLSGNGNNGTVSGTPTVVDHVPLQFRKSGLIYVPVSSSTYVSSVGTANGLGGATGVGVTIAKSVGTADGVGTASGWGARFLQAVGTADGTGVATAYSARILPSVGTADGTGVATGGGAKLIPSVGSADGTGVATGVGVTIAQAIGSCDGTGVASGVGVTIAQAIGSADGVGVANGVGDYGGATAAVGSADGVGQATGVGVTIAKTLGTCDGVGTATGYGVAITKSAGSADGVGDATAVGVTIATSSSTVAGTSTVSGVGVTIVQAVGSADGVGGATGYGITVAQAVGSADGVGDATAVGELAGASVGTAQGVGDAVGHGATIIPSVGTANGTSTVIGSSSDGGAIYPQWEGGILTP